MILSCNNITKTFGTDAILSDCSFHIEEREKAAIVGPNGAGKSTLLKIIMGRLPADDGTVTISKDKTLGYLAQHQNLSSDGTIYDELLSVKKDIIALEEKIRETEQQMKNATGEQLDTLLDLYTKMNHQFELENGYAYQSEIVGVLKGLGFTEDDFVIGFVSRITLQKAPLDFVKSIAIAHQKDARIKALLVGEGDMEEETKEAIRQNGIEEYIRTSPFRNDVPDVLHAINVFCLPSLWEGLSIALLEAMAMKKALVVTPTDGTREVITHQESGLIADFGQPEELAECYLTYLHYPEWIESYGNAAMAVIQERFDSRRVSQQVIEVYYDILQ